MDWDQSTHGVCAEPNGQQPVISLERPASPMNTGRFRHAFLILCASRPPHFERLGIMHFPAASFQKTLSADYARGFWPFERSRFPNVFVLPCCPRHTRVWREDHGKPRVIILERPASPMNTGRFGHRFSILWPSLSSARKELQRDYAYRCWRFEPITIRGVQRLFGFYLAHLTLDWMSTKRRLPWRM